MKTNKKKRRTIDGPTDIVPSDDTSPSDTPRLLELLPFSRPKVGGLLDLLLWMGGTVFANVAGECSGHGWFLNLVVQQTSI